MAGGIPLSSGIEIESQRPADARSYNVDVPYTSIAEALSLILTYKRVPKLEVHIGASANTAVIYWFKNGILDADLILKVEGGASVVIVDNLASIATDEVLSANQGKVLKAYIDAINGLLTSDDVALDELQELVDFIKVNKDTLDTLGIANISGLTAALAGKVDKVAGKELSEEDFTTILKNKLDTIPILQYIGVTASRDLIDADKNKCLVLENVGIVINIPLGLDDDFNCTITPTSGNSGSVTFEATIIYEAENGLTIAQNEMISVGRVKYASIDKYIIRP